LIQQNSHYLQSRSFGRGHAACGVFENGVDLVSLHAREPVKKFVDGSPALEICEKGGDRHARTAKNPRTAHAISVSFHRATTSPVEHVPDSIQLSRTWKTVPVGNRHLRYK
jgi:hypothetical protein